MDDAPGARVVAVLRFGRFTLDLGRACLRDPAGAWGVPSFRTRPGGGWRHGSMTDPWREGLRRTGVPAS